MYFHVLNTWHILSSVCLRHILADFWTNLGPGDVI
jgi:hypothetical protein